VKAKSSNPLKNTGSAKFGGLVWLGVGLLRLVGLVELQLVEQLFLLAPLVIVPLGLALVEVAEGANYERRLCQGIQIGQPACALLVVAAFLSPAGPLAGLLTLGWLGLTGLVGLLGVAHFLARGRFDIREATIAAGLIYLPVGGGWLALSRLGLNPLGFDDLIVLLTAVHFHYAGFAAPLITGLTGQVVFSFPALAQKLYRGSAAGVIIGPPLVAVGITLSPLLELAGALVLATSLGIVAWLTGFIVLRTVTSRPAQIGLTVSAICLIIGMVFTYLYAVGEFTGAPLISIPQMVRIHGLVNSLGFALGGLLGWNIRQTDLNESHLST
jgi:hypothetical protein